jgi:hypothetical protein
MLSRLIDKNAVDHINGLISRAIPGRCFRRADEPVAERVVHSTIFLQNVTIRPLQRLLQSNIKRGVTTMSISDEDVAAEVETTVARLPGPQAAMAVPRAILTQADDTRDKLRDGFGATLSSISVSQHAMADEWAAMARELDNIARNNLMASGDGLIAVWRAGSMAEAVETQLRVTRQQLEAAGAVSARIAEMGLSLFTAAAKPFLVRQPDAAMAI